MVASAFAQTDTTEYLSARLERLLLHSQSWGELGVNVAAHELHKAGEALRVGPQTYTNGLGHHANGRLVILLDGDFDRFEADVGVQPCPGGSVIFRVSVDGRSLFDSGILRSGDTARPVSVSVAGAQELVLDAFDAGDGISCDMANWVNARLLRTRESRPSTAIDAVDIARFAQVVASDPSRLDGARASRVEEFRAEDVFLETEIRPDADGVYTLEPDNRGMACVGLKWFDRRPLRELRLRLLNADHKPPADRVTVQGWFGESAWQGRWLPLESRTMVEGDEWVAVLPLTAPKGGLLQTRKVRWLIPTQWPVRVRDLRAFGRTRWATLDVQVEAENPPAGATGQVRAFDGEILRIQDRSVTHTTGWNDWELARPLRLTLRHSRASTLKANATLLQFRLPAGGVGVGIDDLLASNSVYVPSRGLFVTLPANPTAAPTLADYQRRNAGRKSILDEVRTMPDQTFAQAMARTHREAQNEGPVMLSLAGDNTKFVLDRGGDLHFPITPVQGHDWYAGAGDLRPVFGAGPPDRRSRRLENGWLPIPVITFERGGLRCTERVFVAPVDADGSNPARLNRRSVCVAEFMLENPGAQTVTAQLELQFRLAGKPKPMATLQREGDGRWAAQLGLTRAAVVLEPTGPLSVRASDDRLTFGGALPPQGRSRVVVFLGGEGIGTLESADVPRLRAVTERYWQTVLATSMQIETPDARLNDIIRSSQVRCFIAARHEAEGRRLAPWIAAMAYGPLESEAHSVIRGMDFLGHHDFARRGLEYFLHRYNTNGFLTTGYTTFGTAWHLWTLGEHYRLARDPAWLRPHAAELKRVGDWILRQTEKTRRSGPDGQPVPESGLMPPSVMADWNAFACHFMLNGYYHAALRELGAALASIADPRAIAYTRAAAELRQDILRAYRWTQAQAPALPLRDGSWIPLYPSQVHSPGKLERFFPGDDAGRSWAYDTELGAHQLVPAGVLAPDDAEVTRLLHHFEDVQFLGEGWFDYPAAENAEDWFNLGGFAKVQPYYGRNAEIYALRDDIKPFLRSYFNSLASLLNTEVLTLWEHFRHSGAWDKTHETGYFLHQTRTMLVQERGEELWLAPFIPTAWLQDGQHLEVQNAPTRFGPVSYRIASRRNAREVHVEVTPPTRVAPQRIVVRLRHPENRSLRFVERDGEDPRDFDLRGSTIAFQPGGKTARMTVRFE